MICLHEVLNGNLLAGLELEQFKEILGETLHLGTMSQGQKALCAHAQDLYDMKAHKIGVCVKYKNVDKLGNITRLQKKSGYNYASSRILQLQS